MTKEEIVSVLLAGHVAVIPTDTVYGLAGRPDSQAVGEMFALKGRPSGKPLPVCGAMLGQLESVATFSEEARKLAEIYWPGPLTLVLPRASGFEHDLGGDGDATVAVRVPDRASTLKLLEVTGPLAVTSANVSGQPAASDPATVAGYFPDLPLFDDGPTTGTPSTIVSLVDGFRVLRQGAVTITARGLDA